ncbi:unnamed protein product [Sympodiomycopsis kandeliae]
MSSSQLSSQAPKIVLTRKLPTSILSDAAQKGEIDLVKWDHAEKAADRKWLLENVKGASGVVVMLADKVDRELLDAAGESLKCISTMSVGYDHVDLPTVKQRSIRLAYTPKVLNGAVSDLAIALILGITRQVPLATRIVREGQWSQTPWSPLAFSGPSLEGKTIGFLGFGSIAQTTSLALQHFGPAKIAFKSSSPRSFDINDNYFEELKQGGWEEQNALRKKIGKTTTEVENIDDLNELAAQSDILIVLASLNEKTKHIINKQVFDKMKPSSYIINLARGPLIDTNALTSALAEDQIAGAGLDVLEGEPNVPADHPLLSDAKVKDKVFMMPHVGSANYETRMKMSEITEKSVLGGLGLGDGKIVFEVK